MMMLLTLLIVEHYEYTMKIATRKNAKEYSGRAIDWNTGQTPRGLGSQLLTLLDPTVDWNSYTLRYSE